MSHVREIAKTVTLSTLGAATAYSTVDGNGLVCGAFVSISKAIGASGKVILTSSSTGKPILTVADPSTLGAYYQPNLRAQGTTGNLLPSSAPVPISLCNERIRIKVASSSGLAGESVSVVVWAY